jgi:hypothetical protein
VSTDPTIVLDAEGFSRVVRRDRDMLHWLVSALKCDWEVFVSAATLVEAVDPQISRAAARWSESKLDVVSVSADTSHTATDMLRTARLHGHTHALDALVAATAAELSRPVTILTSDPADLTQLTQDHPKILVQPLT